MSGIPETEILLEGAIQAARSGGEDLLRYFRRVNPASVCEKSRYDHVSEADQASERAIAGVLQSRFPSIAFLGEEGGIRGEGPLRWIVDPLDGTLNYLQGFPHWCISIALWNGDQPWLGCVYDPLRDDLFSATKGKGAHWNGRPMRVSEHPGLDGAFLATGFAFQLGERFPLWLSGFQNVWSRAKGIRRAGSAALDLAHTACGIYDGFWELGLKPWDMAAGLLLVREAGGRVSDWEGQDECFQKGSIVAANPRVHPELRAAIEPL